MLLDPASVVPQPWRNGRGVTRELATGPGWRASLAELTADGPFSPFPGLDRVFTPLAGGFELVVDGAPVPTQALRPVRFRGESDVELRGLARPTSALNVMTERGRWEVDVRVVPADAPADPAAPAAAGLPAYSRPTTLRVALGAHVAEVRLTPTIPSPRST